MNITAPYKKLIQIDIFLVSSLKHVVGTHSKDLIEALLTSTHNIIIFS